MNTSSTRRFLSALATFATLGVSAFAIGVAFDLHPLALFSIAASALILLGAARDYSPALSYAAVENANRVATRTPERHALAA